MVQLEITKEQDRRIKLTLIGEIQQTQDFIANNAWLKDEQIIERTKRIQELTQIWDKLNKGAWL